MQTLSESYIQFQCFQWHWNNYPDERGLLFAVPNGGLRNAREASAMKATGTVPGVADMIYFAPCGAVAIEFKAEGGKQSDNQKHWQAAIVLAGYKYFLVRDILEFQNIIVNLHQ